MGFALVVIATLFAFYLQLLNAAVQRGAELKIQRCAAAQALGSSPPHCRR